MTTTLSLLKITSSHNAAMKMGVQIHLQYSDFIFFGYTLRSSRLYASYISNF